MRFREQSELLQKVSKKSLKNTAISCVDSSVKNETASQLVLARMPPGYVTDVDRIVWDRFVKTLKKHSANSVTSSYKMTVVKVVEGHSWVCRRMFVTLKRDKLSKW